MSERYDTDLLIDLYENIRECGYARKWAIANNVNLDLGPSRLFEWSSDQIAQRREAFARLVQFRHEYARLS